MSTPDPLHALEDDRASVASCDSCRAYQSLLDRFRAPFLLLDGDGRICACNGAAAEAADRELVRLTNGRFQLADVRAQRRMEQLLEGRDPTASATIRFVAKFTRATAYVSRTDSGLDRTAPIWAVFIFEQKPGFEVPHCLLQQFFDLSPAECSVVSTLIAGHRTERIARQLQLARSTLRTHLKNVYRKTGTSSQAQLVAMLAATFPL